MNELWMTRLFTSKLNVRRCSLKEIHHIKASKDFNIEELNVKFDTTHPAEHVPEIQQSKDITHKVETTFPEYYVPIIEGKPSRHLEFQRRILHNTERKLKRARQKMSESKAQSAKEWKDLEVKEDQLRENFIEFDQFLKDNGEKRVRALEKIEEQQNLTRKRETQIKAMEEETEKMSELQRRMKEQIKQLKPHEIFLQKVARISSYRSINEVINRFYSLQLAKETLASSQKNNLYILESSKTIMMKLIEEKNFVIMGLNNQIANLQARYENANIKALESEALVTQIKNNAVKQLGEIDTVKNSIWNVYVHMASSKKHPIKIKKDNVEEQMMYINRTLTELSKINKIITKKAKQAIKY